MNNFGRLIIAALLTTAPVLPATAALPVPVLQEQVPTLAPMLKRTMPGVVSIVALGEVKVAENPLLNDPFFRHFFDLPQRPPVEETQSIGSGVIVDDANGYVITNHHVIAKADTINVRLSDDREFEAKLIGADPETDIAVLKIDADELTAIPVGDSDAMEVGDFVVAIGNPFGLRQTVTSGIVSGLGRSGLGGRYEDFIQTDASINPGNSGGALVNLKGELVGINTKIYSRSGGNIGLGFAIPTALVSQVMEQILEFGEVQRGRLGIMGQDLSADLATAFGLENTRGVAVTRIIKNSPADKAGIREGDIILRVEDRDVRNFSQLRNAIGLRRAGEKVRIELLRDGKPKTITAVLGDGAATEVSAEKVHPRLKGAAFSEIAEDHPLAGEVSGILVSDVKPGSAAARAGLRKGDIITSVNRVPVSDLAAFGQAAGGQGQLLLHIRRGRGAMFILLS